MEKRVCWLTIQPHVLGKGLGQQDVVALLNEVTHSPSVTIDVSAGKTLIGHVEEREQIPFLEREEKRESR